MHGSGKSGMSGGMNAGGVACAFSCCVCCWYMPVMTFTDIEKSEHGISVMTQHETLCSRQHKVEARCSSAVLMQN